MKHHTSLKLRLMLLATLLLLVPFGSLFTGTGRVKAASTSWSQTINSVATVSLFSNDSAIAAGNCDPDPAQYAANTYSSAGVLTSSIPSTTNPQPCADYRTEAVDSMGNVYTVSIDQQSGAEFVSKYYLGKLVWSVAPPSSQNVLALKLGADGNIYGVSDTTANTGGTIALFGFNSQLAAGQTTPTLILNKPLTVQAGLFGGLDTYYGGLVVQVAYGSLTYYSYDGTVLKAASLPIYSVGLLTVAFNGDVFLPVPASQPAQQLCPTPTYPVDSSILTYGPSGTIWSYPLPSCTSVVMARPTPNDGVVALVTKHDTLGTLTRSLISINSGGVESWSQGVPYSYNGTTYGDPIYYVDASGDVATALDYTDSTNNKGVLVFLDSGLTGLRVTTQDFSPDATSGGYAMSENDNSAFAIASGMAYIVLSRCGYSSNGGAVGCGGQTIYAFGVASLALDYPRSSVLTGSQTNGGVTFAVLGDSFSSGEGLEPFYPDTTTSDNNCHRSYLSYAADLDHNNGGKVRLIGFFACSGATTPDVYNSAQYTAQPPQAQSLSLIKNVNWVILTLGGNDIDFADFAGNCVLHFDFSCNSVYKNTLNNLKALPGQLNRAYKAIKGSIGKTTKVLVLGYPLIIGKNSSTLYCGLMTAHDRAMARDVESRLNTTVQNAVSSAGSQFVYLNAASNSSPFNGHELCTKNPYFYDPSVVPPNTNYSFHPNLKGEEFGYLAMVTSYWQKLGVL